MKIVVIEDNDNMRSYINGLVKNISEVVGNGESGEDAINLYEKLKPDLMIMDIELKGMDGLTASMEIKQSHPNAKFIFVTNYNDSSLKQKALSIKGSYFFLKENLNEFVQLIKQIKGEMY